MKTNQYLSSIFSLALIGVTACSSNVPDAENKKKSSNVATTDTDGVVTAEVDADAKTEQTVVSSPNSKIAETAVSFPPGTLAVSTTIALGEATESSNSMVTELGLASAIVKSATPVFVGSATGDAPITAGAIGLSLPLPLSDLGLGLTTAGGKLVFLYAYYSSAGWKTGVKPLTAADLVGTFLHADVLGFGYFQIAYMATAVEAKEIVTLIRPSLKK